jgi:methylated-DNA-[protein]-cysteine S-methyltransferase
MIILRKKNRFDCKLNPQGTDFQKRVWAALLISLWKTRTYLEQAKILEMSKPFEQ